MRLMTTVTIIQKIIRRIFQALVVVLAGVFLFESACLAATSGRDTELTSIDFLTKWRSVSDNEFPASARPAFLKHAGKDLEDYPSGMYQFVSVDLNGDGKNELIVADPASSGSGGQTYFISGKAWIVIGGFQGGFVLTIRDDLVKYPEDYYRIISYYRSGDTYQNVYDYKSGRYRLTSQTMMPRAITDTQWWRSFWNQLNAVRPSR